jgi:hypothetical protein
MRAMDNLPIAAAILGGLLLFSIYLWLSQRKADPTEEGTLARFARKHGLTLASPTETRGIYQQRALRLSTESRTAEGTHFMATLVSVDVSDALPPEFSLKRAAPGSTQAPPAEGAQAEATGTTSFESAFSVTNASPETREALNTPAVQESCTRLAQHDGFHIENGWLHVEHRGVPATVEALEALVDAVLEAPRALAAAVASSRYRPSA